MHRTTAGVAQTSLILLILNTLLSVPETVGAIEPTSTSQHVTLHDDGTGTTTAATAAAAAASTTATTADNNIPPLARNRRGGLRWRDLGVSFESCSMDTSVMLRRKYSNGGIINDECEVEGENNEHRRDVLCLDDSLWLLHPTSGFVEDGSLCGIIGPSGSGKSTFLSALGGTTPRNSGVFLSGSVWYEEVLVMLENSNHADAGHTSSKDENNIIAEYYSDDANDNNIISTTIHAPANDTNNNKTIYNRYHLSQQEGDIAMLSQHDNFFDMLTPRESMEFAAYLELQKRRVKSSNNNAENNNDQSSSTSLNHKELAQQILTSLGLLSVADRRIGDRTKLDGGDNGSGGINIDWGSISSWPKTRRRQQHLAITGSKKCNSAFGLRDGSGMGKNEFSKTRRGGGLSGGERRRLSVAMELVTEPKIFLADEPTTGLDSAQAEKVVKLISRLAKERNVPSICTLHQPKTSIWKALDSFILLAPGGKMCYSGDRKNATAYFKGIGFECPPETNPAEYFIDLVTIDTDDTEKAVADTARIDFLHHHFLETCTSIIHDDDNAGAWTPPQSGLTRQKTSNDGNPFSLSFVIQTKMRSVTNTILRFAALLQRSLRQNIRNSRVNILRLSAAAMQAVLFSAIFKSVREDKSMTKSIADRVALLTYGVVNMSIMSLMKTLDLFARERGVVTREQMRRNYFSLEYLLAKVFSEIPLDTGFVLVFAAILKRLTGLRTSLITLMKTFSLMTVSSVSLGFAIGSVTSSVETAMSSGVPIMVLFMILGVINPSGVNVDEKPNIITEWLKLLSPIKWAIESLVVAEFRDMDFDDKDRGIWGNLRDLPRMGALAMVKNGNEVLQNLGLGNAKYSELMEKLAILSGVYLLSSWAGLCFGGPKFMDTTAL